MALLQDSFDLVVLTCSAEDTCTLKTPGAVLPGTPLAMEVLTQENQRKASHDETRTMPRGSLTAMGKRVIVPGSEDTRSNCLGTPNRQGAAIIDEAQMGKTMLPY